MIKSYRPSKPFLALAFLLLVTALAYFYAEYSAREKEAHKAALIDFSTSISGSFESTNAQFLAAIFGDLERNEIERAKMLLSRKIVHAEESYERSKQTVEQPWFVEEAHQKFINSANYKSAAAFYELHKVE